jgi:uncharacterized protein involved in exopolysaccharide biosynthesis
MAEKKSYSELFGAEAHTPPAKAEPAGKSASADGGNGEQPPAGDSTAKERPRHVAIIPGYEQERIKERKILTLRDLLYIFFKHLQSIIVITLICFLTALTYSFSVTPLYKADTKILVKLGREKLADVNEYSRNVNILFQERNQNVNNELEIFKGDELSQMVYEDLKDHFDTPEQVDHQQGSRLSDLVDRIKTRLLGANLSDKDEAVLFLKNSLRVEFLAETDILKLSFSSPKPEFAAIGANAYADAFVRLRTKIYETKKSHNFYIEQIALYKKMVDDLVAQEKEVSQKWRISEIEQEKVLVLKNKDQLENDYLKVQQDYNRTITLLEGIEQMYATPGSWIETPKMSENEMVDRQSYWQDIDRQYFTLKLERSRLTGQGQFTEKSNEVKNIDLSLAQLRKQKYTSLLNVLDLNRNVLETGRNKLAQELDKKNTRIEELIQATYALQQLKVNKDVALESFLNYTKKAEDLRIYDDLDKNQITSLSTINRAILPLQAYFPKKWLILFTAIFFGVFLSFGLSAIKEFFTHVFRDGQDVERVLKVPLLMSINHQEEKR